MKKSLLILVLLLSGCSKIPPSALQPGLQFYTDIDEVRFVCSRSFREGIEIVARRPYRQPKAAPQLIITRYPMPSKAGEQPPPIEVTKKISEEAFTELRGVVTRQDLIEHSLIESPISTDGSLWSIEGRKGDFVIKLERRNPLQIPDLAFVTVGKRFLDLAGISIPTSELY
jgi:hypothetical protein